MLTKRLPRFLMLLFALALVAAACNGDEPDAALDEPDDPDAEDPATEADAEEPDDGETFQITYGHYQPRGAGVEGEGRLLDLLEEYSDGRITVDAHWAEALGTSPELPRLTEQGATDMGTLASHHDPDPYPFYRVQQMNFFASGDSLEDIRRQDRTIREVLPLPQFDEELEGYNQRAVVHQYLAPFWLWSDEPGCDLDHLDGKRIRGLGSDYPRMLEAAGATPVSLTPPEMYEAMDRGTVDMISIAQQHIDAFDLYDVVSYACGPIFVMGAGHSTTMNLDFWESLPADLQELVDDTAAEVQDWWLDYVLETEQELRGELEEAGITFQEFPEEDRAEWQERTPDFLSDWLDDMEDRDYGDEAQEVHDLLRDIWEGDS